MKKILTVAFLGILALASCTKDQSASVGGKVSSIDEIKVPSGFLWENSRDVDFDVTISDTRFPDAFYVVTIYDGDPSQGGRMLAKGSASQTVHFLSKVYLANTIKEVFVLKTAPDNSTTTQKVSVGTSKVSLAMSVANDAGGALEKIKGISDSPDCSTGCSRTITTSQNITVNSGETVCITGSNIAVGITAYGGTVRVCGQNVTLNSPTFDTNGSLIVTSTGSVTMNSIAFYQGSTSFKNYGTVTLNNTLAYNATFLNEGTIAITGDLNVYSGSTFTNNGTVNIGGSLILSTSNQTTNSGSIIATNDVQVNSGSLLVNNCSIWAKRDYFNTGTTKNYNLIKVNGTTQLYASTEMGLYGGALFKTANVVVSGTIKGYTSTSMFKVTGTSTLYSSAAIVNLVQYCDAGGIETNQATFSGGAALSCSQYIPITNCNTEGNGTPPVTDTDGDGVMDPQDEYPNDATKAYNNYYPNNSPTSGETVAFEDKWPLKGDYDLNDLVMSYRYKIVTNAANKVVQVNGDYTLHATGGYFKNGFAVEFPILRTAVSGLTGGTLESGQTKAVVVLFNDMRTEMAQWNTRIGETASAVKTYTVSFNVSGLPALSTFGLGSYNPFIWTNLGRGYEVHLAGKTPTNLATTSLYGTGDDYSNIAAGRYYKTSTGLPWAVAMPIKPFEYPVEETGITGAYLKFQAWAESGGAQFTDWYSNTANDYRDASKIYH